MRKACASFRVADNKDVKPDSPHFRIIIPMAPLTSTVTNPRMLPLAVGKEPSPAAPASPALDVKLLAKAPRCRCRRQAASRQRAGGSRSR